MKSANPSGRSSDVSNRSLAVVLLVACFMLMMGCRTNPGSETLEDELVQVFGSYANACDAKMEILPYIYRKVHVEKPSAEDRKQILDAIKGCVRCRSGHPRPQQDKDARPNGFRCAIDVRWEIRLSSPGKVFSIYFDERGFLCEYIYTSPDMLLAANFMLCQCVEMCNGEEPPDKQKE